MREAEEGERRDEGEGEVGKGGQRGGGREEAGRGAGEAGRGGGLGEEGGVEGYGRRGSSGYPISCRLAQHLMELVWGSWWPEGLKDALTHGRQRDHLPGQSTPSSSPTGSSPTT